MQSSENRVIIACAGSGKTTLLVKEALSSPDRRIVLLTYTHNNTREIINRFGELNGGVPKHVDVVTWFAFLLHEGARPYQRALYSESRIESIAWGMSGRSPWGIRETDTRRFYFADGNLIYPDKISQFIIRCETESGQRVTARMRQIYTDVFIDEFQDLAGWDLEFVAMLLRSGIRVTIVGDPRQHIYSTNPSPKNTQYQGINVIGLIKDWEKHSLCRIETMSGTFRCNQAICDFANGLWPGMDDMKARTCDKTEHDGVFLIPESAVGDYLERFKPQVLRYDKRSKAYGCAPLNFRLAKGLEFDRVLIVPTGRIKKYLKSGNTSDIEKIRNRLHVAVTRARHSVGFVYDGPSPIVPTRWQAGSEPIP